MTMAFARWIGPTRHLLATPQVSSAFALCAIAVGVASQVLIRLIGWPGVIAMVASLAVLGLAIILTRRAEIEWNGLLPISLTVFVGWATLSVIWSQYQWSSLGGIAYLLAFTLIGLTIALTRDTIQIVRACGDAFRAMLGLSFALEILSGVLLDTPFAFLGIEGRLASLGPIQGVMGSRNQLGLLALVALVTFSIEFATRSIPRSLAGASMGMALAAVLLSRSPVAGAVLVLVAVAGGALVILRRVPVQRRTAWQLVSIAAAIVLAGLSWGFRARIIDFFSASSELGYRLDLWRRVWDLSSIYPLQGWGWVGYWRTEVQPFPAFAIAGQREPTSALNAYIDVWFQLGLIGIFAFAVLAILALTRSWLLAGRQRSVVFVWPALVLLTLLVTSLAESSILVEYGWLLFVVCSVKAARELSWRSAFGSTT